jgi:hypothetical protein
MYCTTVQKKENQNSGAEIKSMVSVWVQPPKWPEPFNKEAKSYTDNLYGKQREAKAYLITHNSQL